MLAYVDTSTVVDCDGGRKDYRYAFQGQEKDDEIKGEGNSVNYTFRMHDPRLGRFFAIDPLTAKFPYYSPYQFSGNRVIDCIELEGAEEYHYTLKKNEKSELECTDAKRVGNHWLKDIFGNYVTQYLYVYYEGQTYFFSSKGGYNGDIKNFYENFLKNPDPDKWFSEEEMDGVRDDIAKVYKVFEYLKPSPLKVNKPDAGKVSGSLLKGSKFDKFVGGKKKDLQFKKPGKAEDDFNKAMKEFGIKKSENPAEGVRTFKVDKTTYTLRKDSKGGDTISIKTENNDQQIKIRYDGKSTK